MIVDDFAQQPLCPQHPQWEADAIDDNENPAIIAGFNAGK